MKKIRKKRQARRDMGVEVARLRREQRNLLMAQNELRGMMNELCLFKIERDSGGAVINVPPGMFYRVRDALVQIIYLLQDGKTEEAAHVARDALNSRTVI